MTVPLQITVQYCHRNRNEFNDGAMKIYIFFHYYFRILNKFFEVILHINTFPETWLIIKLISKKKKMQKIISHRIMVRTQDIRIFNYKIIHLRIIYAFIYKLAAPPAYMSNVNLRPMSILDVLERCWTRMSALVFCS